MGAYIYLHMTIHDKHTRMHTHTPSTAEREHCAPEMASGDRRTLWCCCTARPPGPVHAALWWSAPELALSQGFGPAPRVVSSMVAPSLHSPSVHRRVQSGCVEILDSLLPQTEKVFSLKILHRQAKLNQVVVRHHEIEEEVITDSDDTHKRIFTVYIGNLMIVNDGKNTVNFIFN